MRSKLGKRERRAREDSVIEETSRHLTCLMESQPKLILIWGLYSGKICLGKKNPFMKIAEGTRV